MTQAEERPTRRTGGYFMAATLGAIGGGLAVAMTGDKLPKLLAEMKERAQEMCAESCECLPEKSAKKVASKETQEAAN